MPGVLGAVALILLSGKRKKKREGLGHVIGEACEPDSAPRRRERGLLRLSCMINLAEGQDGCHRPAALTPCSPAKYTQTCTHKCIFMDPHSKKSGLMAAMRARVSTCSRSGVVGLEK